MNVRRRAPVLLALFLPACGSVAPVSPTPELPSQGSSPLATATAVPSSTPTVGPAATPPSTWEADAAALGRLLTDLTALQKVADAHGGVRAAGTSGYEASVDWAAAELGAAGFEVSRPEVAFTGFRDLGVTLRVDDRTFSGPDEARALIYSASGTVEGPVTILDESGCEPEHFAGVSAGAVVVTTQGGCFRRDQALNAADAGASGLLVGYPGRGAGEIFRPTLIFPDGIDLPVASVTDEALQALEAADGEVVALAVVTEREPDTFRNVIGQLGDGPRVVMVGAHLDSVLDGPGINDNGSGVAAVIELARTVAAAGVPDGWAVRIGLWGAEEFGTYGSRAYASATHDIVAYLNLDMAGSINGASLVYDEGAAAPGSERITLAYEAWFARHALPTQRVDLGSSSDHGGFTQAGIPTGGLFAGASESGSATQPGAPSSGPAPDPCYHIGCDDLGNVDVERVALFSEATTAVVLELMGH